MFPILLKIGRIAVRTYGVMLAAGFLVGTWVASKEARRQGVEPNKILDFSTYALVCGLIGARFYYIAFFDPMLFVERPLEFFAFWQGGLSIHGGILGGGLAGLWFVRKNKIPIWKFLDICAPGLIIGQAIGRIGCLFSGCCYGIRTSLPWGIEFTHAHSLAPLFVRLHPTQIYEALLNLGIFLIIWFGVRKAKKFEGWTFLWYLILYSGVRFFVEFFRADSLYLWGTNIKLAQAVSIGIIVVAGGILGRKIILYRRGPN